MVAPGGPPCAHSETAASANPRKNDDARQSALDGFGMAGDPFEFSRLACHGSKRWISTTSRLAGGASRAPAFDTLAGKIYTIGRPHLRVEAGFLAQMARQTALEPFYMKLLGFGVRIALLKDVEERE